MVEAEGYSTLTASWTTSEGEDEGEQQQGSGTETDPYIWTELPENVTFNSDTINKVYYQFTATESGTITFTWPTADSWYGISKVNATSGSDSTSGYQTTTATFNLESGASYRFDLPG